MNCSKGKTGGTGGGSGGGNGKIKPKFTERATIVGELDIIGVGRKRNTRICAQRIINRRHNARRKATQ